MRDQDLQIADLRIALRNSMARHGELLEHNSQLLERARKAEARAHVAEDLRVLFETAFQEYSNPPRSVEKEPPPSPPEPAVQWVIFDGMDTELLIEILQWLIARIGEQTKIDEEEFKVYLKARALCDKHNVPYKKLSQ
jgi:hypothetical protein